MKITPILKTNRLILRPFEEKDLNDVFEWCSTFENTEFVYWWPHRSIEVTEKLLSKWIRQKKNYSWAIELDKKVVGEIQVYKDLPDGGFSLGYIINKSFWGRGVAKEALSRILDFLFKECGYKYSIEVCDERNVASRHLLESFGYSLTSIEKNVYIAKRDIHINEARYILKAEDLKYLDKA